MPKKTFFKLPSKVQASIIETAMDIYIQNPFENITIRTLSEQLNVSMGSFYDYFHDKDELYFYIFDSLINKLLFSGYYKNHMFHVPRPALEDYLTEREVQFYRTFRGAPEYMKKKYYFDTEVNSIYSQYVQQEFERIKREGKMRDELDSDFMAYIYLTISFNVAMYFDRNFPGAPIERKHELCNQVYHILQHGMFQCDDEESAH